MSVVDIQFAAQECIFGNKLSCQHMSEFFTVPAKIRCNVMQDVCAVMTEPVHDWACCRAAAASVRDLTPWAHIPVLVAGIFHIFLTVLTTPLHYLIF